MLLKEVGAAESTCCSLSRRFIMLQQQRPVRTVWVCGCGCVCEIDFTVSIPIFCERRNN